MASRKDQKQQLRREREEREAAAKAAERRRQMIGYGAGLAVVIVAIVIGVILLAGAGNGGGAGKTEGGGEKQVAADVLPEGGEVPAVRTPPTPLTQAVQAAGCELRSYRGDSRDHTENLGETIEYESKPPTSGRHFQVEAQDSDYEQAPDVKELVHSMEHGRIVVWFKQELPKSTRATLKALYDEDPFQMLLTPDETDSIYELSATAWNRDPVPNGTGRLLGCEKYTPEAVEAIRAFKEEHRSNGPEPVP